MTDRVDHFMLWNTVSMAWTEIGLDDKDCQEISRQIPPCRHALGVFRQDRPLAFGRALSKPWRLLRASFANGLAGFQFKQLESWRCR